MACLGSYNDKPDPQQVFWYWVGHKFDDATPLLGFLLFFLMAGLPAWISIILYLSRSSP